MLSRDLSGKVIGAAAPRYSRVNVTEQDAVR